MRPRLLPLLVGPFALVAVSTLAGGDTGWTTSTFDGGPRGATCRVDVRRTDGGCEGSWEFRPASDAARRASSSAWDCPNTRLLCNHYVTCHCDVIDVDPRRGKEAIARCEHERLFGVTDDGALTWASMHWKTAAPASAVSPCPQTSATTRGATHSRDVDARHSVVSCRGRTPSASWGDRACRPIPETTTR